MPVLSLWVEHYARDWILFALNCHDKLFSIFSVCGKDVEKVGEGFSFGVCVRLDYPVVGMVKKGVFCHFFNQILRKLAKHISQYLYHAVFYLKVHRT